MSAYNAGTGFTKGLKSNAGVPLEPTLQPALRLGSAAKSGVGDKNPQKGRENTGSVAPPRQDGTLTDRMW